MNQNEYEMLAANREPFDTFIRAHEINGPDRTLLYGYTCDRHDWHVYLKGGMIHWIEVMSSRPENPVNSLAGGGIRADQAVPDKRVYPESTDYLFAELIQDRGVEIPFLKYNSGRYEALKSYPFHGPIWLNGVPTWDRENGIVPIWGKENGI